MKGNDNEERRRANSPVSAVWLARRRKTKAGVFRKQFLVVTPCPRCVTYFFKHLYDWRGLVGVLEMTTSSAYAPRPPTAVLKSKLLRVRAGRFLLPAYVGLIMPEHKLRRWLEVCMSTYQRGSIVNKRSSILSQRQERCTLMERTI